MRSRKLKLAILAGVAVGFALALAEITLRVLPEPEQRALPGQLSYQTADGKPITLGEGIQNGSIVQVPKDQTPRPRYTWAPNASFYLCYSDHERLARDWLDEQGRVFVHINQFGLRERDDITPDKPAGQRRLVCIGDSFTFGWGVPEELGWVRMLEGELRKVGRNVRTVNCGAAGALVVDEDQWALEHRFGRFDPDAVLVTLCLNDLIPCSGLFVQGPVPDTGLKLLDLTLGALGHSHLELDPAIDWVGVMMNLPRAEGEAAGLYSRTNPYEAMWAQGAPQRALAAMKAWCEKRNIKLLVALWPFLQGLGEARHYPFAKLHEQVAAECARQGIPFHDVLPALRGTPAAELWVTPADMHANPTAHRLALPGLVAFVKQHAALD